MKLFLFLVFFAFSANAGVSDTDTALSCRISGYSSSGVNVEAACPKTGGISCSENANLFHCNPDCVEDNRGSCESLGYTAQGSTQLEACPYGGVACPFDGTKWNCAKWTCADGNLFKEAPENMACTPVSFKGNICYRCGCADGYVDYNGCQKKVGNLIEDRNACDALGYTSSVTSCAEYLACPSNPNKVRCLDSFGECSEVACLQQVIVPENATPISEIRTCTCGEPKQVIINWVCNDGYRQVGSDAEKEAGTATCVEEYACAQNEFENNLDIECYEQGKIGAGWSKGLGQFLSDNTYSKQCYECVCTLPEGCHKYSNEEKGANGTLKDLCCDGESYQKCVVKCPTGVRVPSFAEPSDTDTCEACGQTFPVNVAWQCINGYALNDKGTGCDPVACSASNADGVYYGLFTKSECENQLDSKGNSIGGWAYTSETGILSGSDVCHECRCHADEQGYQYDIDGTTNQNDAVYSNFGCNNKYKNCIPSETAPADRITSLPENVAQEHHYFICGTKYYSIDTCNAGYTKSADGKSCVADTCAGYTLTICPVDEHNNEIATCQPCTSGSQTLYKVKECKTVLVDNKYITYKKNGDTCCRETCPTGYKPEASCSSPAGGDPISNECGNITCVPCNDL